MELPKIDMFSNGSLEILAPPKIIRDPKTNQIEEVPCPPVEIKSYEELACRVCRYSDVENLVDRELKSSKQMKIWRKAMPRKTPNVIAKHQMSPNSVNSQEVTEAINKIGAFLPQGQVLFHGGNLHSGFIDRPLSTTFCPQVARQEAVHNGKAKAVGCVNIYKITITSDGVNGYAFKQKRTNLGNEKEVLIAGGHEFTVGDVIFEDALASGTPIKVFEASIK